uniref:Integrase catalytic domain-containing protein n=1 Tax=Amphimedon queenslandica TaxID=400682 RepID=A0A1X7V9V9_AMPQE
MVERLNRTLLSMLATSAKDNSLNWEDYLQLVCFAYNTSTHSSTGFTPFYLMYGREPHLPVDLNFGVHSPSSEDLSIVAYSRQMQIILNYAYQKVRKTVGNVQQQQKALYDHHVHGTPYTGDMVWLYSAVTSPNSHRKLYHHWTGPYQILSKLSHLNYKIAPTNDLRKTSIVHFDR